VLYLFVVVNTSRPRLQSHTGWQYNSGCGSRRKQLRHAGVNRAEGTCTRSGHDPAALPKGPTCLKVKRSRPQTNPLSCPATRKKSMFNRALCNASHVSRRNMLSSHYTRNLQPVLAYMTYPKSAVFWVSPPTSGLKRNSSKKPEDAELNRLMLRYLVYYFMCLFIGFHLGQKLEEARGSVVAWSTMLQAERWRFRFPMRSLEFFNWPNPSSRTMALGSTQPLTKMSTRNLPRGKKRPARKADNLTAICESSVYKMWEPRRLTTLWASTACYRESFAFYRG
jgi:hypothetical protein